VLILDQRYVFSRARLPAAACSVVAALIFRSAIVFYVFCFISSDAAREEPSSTLPARPCEISSGNPDFIRLPYALSRSQSDGICSKARAALMIYLRYKSMLDISPVVFAEKRLTMDTRTWSSSKNLTLSFYSFIVIDTSDTLLARLLCKK